MEGMVLQYLPTEKGDSVPTLVHYLQELYPWRIDIRHSCTFFRVNSTI